VGSRTFRRLLIACLALLCLLTAAPSYGAFPGANGRVAFVSQRDGNPEIYTGTVRGSNPTRLTNDPADDLEPTWSPDGTRIAFASLRDGNYEVYVINADGSDLFKVTNNPAADLLPAWSPNGTRLAFTSDRAPSGQPEIYTMNADGSDIAQVTDLGGDSFDPAWSPDGTRIAFRHSGQIFTVHPDGTALTPLTSGVDFDSEPAWSPDGSEIAFARFVSTSYDVFKMDADGTGAVDLTNTTDPSENGPAWAPDGSKILYNGPVGVSVMNPDGTGQRTTIADGSEPDWQPLAGPRRSDYTTASSFCKAQRDFLGESDFAGLYGTNGNGKNAYGNCVSQSH
jgi:TolB protein